jgi:uncharacterized protein
MPEKAFAVVTGASSGIGYELAAVLAENGYDLLVNSEDDIERVTGDFKRLGASVRSVRADLSDRKGVEALWRAVEETNRPIDVIAINAGIGVGGDFARETDLESELKMVQLNVAAVVHIAKLAVRHMVERGEGKILITSSIAGTMPTPLEAVYGATKAFDLAFARSLRYELKDTGVSVTALQPGPTDTNFFHRAGMDNTEVGSEGKYTNDPHEVAKQGYGALMDGKDHIYASSMKTKMQGELGRFMPESVKAEQHRKMAQPKTETK